MLKTALPRSQEQRSLFAFTLLIVLTLRGKTNVLYCSIHEALSGVGEESPAYGREGAVLEEHAESPASPQQRGQGTWKGAGERGLEPQNGKSPRRGMGVFSSTAGKPLLKREN